ncbi:hypothetical protein [Nitrospira sp. Nam74]
MDMQGLEDLRQRDIREAKREQRASRPTYIAALLFAHARAPTGKLGATMFDFLKKGAEAILSHNCDPLWRPGRLPS